MPKKPDNVSAAADAEYLTRFRNAVAGAVRDLLAAREAAEPGAIPTKTIGRWQLPGRAPRPRTSRQLLQSAQRGFRRFWDQFGTSLTSLSGGPADPEAEAQEELFTLLYDFVEDDALNTALAATRGSGVVVWSQLARWDLLNAIRDQLDRLPHRGAPQEPNAPPLPTCELKTVPPYEVHIGGRVLKGVRNMIWRLLDFLLQCPNRTTEKMELREPVWNDRNRRDDNNALLDGLLGDTRRFLKDNRIPWTVKRVREYVSLCPSDQKRGS